ncbi:Fucosyltransferase [Mactra antiquata]
MPTRNKSAVKTNLQVKSVPARNFHPTKEKRKPNNPKTYLVTWYDMITFLQKRPWAASANFSVCDYNNCKISRDKSLASKSDVVLFQGRILPTTLRFKRPNGQIWVFVEVEPPTIIKRLSQKKTKFGVEKFKHEFNWTMTYDKKLADIHLPYGELRKHKKYVNKNYADIALNKTKGGLIVVSHCPVDSKRLDYIKKLNETIDVTVLGSCGTKWNCGRRMFHDDCFSILNGEYAYYLAFENSLCHQYYTEKLYENFKYDTLFVTRGGLPHEATSFFPKGTVIDHDAFLSPQDLGKELKEIMENKEEYARRLAIKSQYYSINFRESYQRALCDLCYRLNHQDQFYKTIPDVLQVLTKKHSCRDGKDRT